MKAAALCGRLAAIVLLGALAAGCAQTYESREVTHKQTALEQPSAPMADSEHLAVRIRAFDPGTLPEDPEKAKGLSMDIRNAEAWYLPVRLKDTMQRSGYWGPVRVVPKNAREGEVTVTGRILESDGELLRLEIGVGDSTGAHWFTREYRTVVDEGVYEAAAKTGTDAFQPMFNEIANDIAAHRKSLPPGRGATVRQVAELRFAAEFAPEAFDGYLTKPGDGETNGDDGDSVAKLVAFFKGVGAGDAEGGYRIRRLPAADDPMVGRVNRIRSREEFLIDTLDQEYDGLARNIGDGYSKWRTSRLKEMNAVRKVEKARSEEQAKAVAIGVLGILAGAALGSSRNCYSCGTAGAAVAGAAVAIAVQKAMNASDQAESETKMHQTALEEAALSLASDVKPVVVEVEGKTVELKGSVDQKFEQWRGVLKELHEREVGTMAPAPQARSD
jgi:outer membrane lipoprotein SlyB